MRKKRLGWIILIIILGCLIGSALGEILAIILPEGVVKEFFLRSADFRLGPTLIDLAVLTFTIGFSIKINVIGVIGVFLIAYFLRWVE